MNLVYIGDDTILLKLHTDRKNQYYWTAMNLKTGQVVELPASLSQTLKQKNWTKCNSVLTYAGQYQLLLANNEEMRCLQFNQDGSLINIDCTEWSSQKVETRHVTQDHSGQIYTIGIVKKGKDPPQFKLNLSNKGPIPYVEIIISEWPTAWPNLVLSGDYLCLRNGSDVHILDIKS